MWLYPANELRRQWHAYYVPDDRLYIFQINRYDHHLPIEFELEFDLNVHDYDLVLPLDAFPVFAEETKQFWETVGLRCHILTPASSTNCPRLVPRILEVFGTLGSKPFSHDRAATSSSRNC